MNIFVAKLDYSTSVETLEALFAEYGEVTSAKIIMDRETQRSKGFGFVEMAEEEDGWNAIRAINGTELDGREIVCKKSEPRENNNRGGGGGGFRKRFNRNDRGGGGGFNRDRNSGGGNRFDRNDRNSGGGNRFDRNDRW